MCQIRTFRSCSVKGQLIQTISIGEGVDALFGATVGIFALARMKATPLMIQEFVNNNFRSLFSTDTIALNH